MLDPIEEVDRAVHLLASLPESYGILVTALEVNEDASNMDIAAEMLLRKENKLKEKITGGETYSDAQAWTLKHRFGRGPRCNH